MMDQPSRHWTTFLQETTAHLSRRLIEFWGSLPSRWRWAWIAAVGVALLIALRSRWWPGVLHPSPACVLLTIAGAFAVLARHRNEGWSKASPRERDPILLIGSLTPLVILLMALLPRLTAFGAGAALTVALYSAGATIFWSQLASPLRLSLPTVLELSTAPGPRGTSEPLAPSEGDTADSSTLQQRLERSAPSPGEDFLEGLIRVPFRAGQKLTTVHVPFTPPFAGLPEVYCEASAESDVRVSVASVLLYGVRIDLRRSDARTAEVVEVEFTAHFTANASCNDSAA